VRAVGDGGRDVCAALTTALDQALQHLAADIRAADEFALVAVGGYGRSELSPYSDVDLMVLHDSDDPSDLAAGILRPLWDANLKVGHSVRTIGEAAAAARERFETHTTLITARHVAGSAGLAGRLSAEVAAVTRARPLRRHLVDEERRRRRENPYLLMATDVKDGRGGLRTLQAFRWVQAREQLIGRYSAEASDDATHAYETLLRIRNGLHAVAGRRYDIFSHDVRQPLARWLDANTIEVSVELVDAIETADRIASHRWPEVTEESGRSRLWRPRRPKGFRTDRPPTAGELTEILRSGEKGRLTLERLMEGGHLERVLPEWENVRGLPQLEPFHEHPVDAHLWRTVDEMQDLTDGEDHYSRVALELDSPVALTLAAFLHDIGKGSGGDHSEVGARIAESTCMALGCSEDVAELVTAGVRHHLLLGRTAARRDIEDPAVIEDVARTVGDLRRLQLLYLLTVADSRATGPTMWSEWKATLLRTLFVRVAGHFGAVEPNRDLSEKLQDLLASVEDRRRPLLEEHLGAMSADYLEQSTTEEILWHLEQVELLNGRFSIDVISGDVADRLLIVGRPHQGLRRIVAEALAANGVDVLQARLRSRKDGVTVDSFVVHDDRTGGTVDVTRWDQIHDDIDSGLDGDPDTTNKVAIRAEAYASVGRRGDIRPAVMIYHDPASGGPVVTVRCADRIGRLAELLAVLSDFGVEIRLAKLDSRAGELVDSFHARQGTVPEDPVSMRDLEAAIASALDA
jgi:[protein-PII] uridylyltransferase